MQKNGNKHDNLFGLHGVAPTATAAAVVVFVFSEWNVCLVAIALWVGTEGIKKPIQ